MTMIDIFEIAGKAEVARVAGFLPVTREDRVEFGRALILQGFSPQRAADKVNELEDNDGALQMLARHRLGHLNEDLRGDPQNVVGAVLSDALDRIKARLADPDEWVMSIYLGHGIDIEAAFLVGNVMPGILATRLRLMEMDGDHLGTVDSTGEIKTDGGKP